MIAFAPLEQSVLTAEEACVYLRLDVGRTMEQALRALNRLVDEKKSIRPCMYRRERMYLKSALDQFLEECQE